jgi:regulator of cell morphogenesis and NO signaling
MHTHSEQTVREIAAANPASTRVFEALGIDYCCGGNLSLSAACARADVPVEKVIASLEACGEVPAQAVPNDAPLSDLARYIVERHHGFVRSESPRIQGLLNKVCDKHGRAHAELFEIQELFAKLAGDMAGHMMKEERILFPYIQALNGPIAPSACFGSVESPIAAMIADHEDAGAILSKLRTLSNGYTAPAGACPTFNALYRALEDFERDLHHHVHLENNILFPRAIEAERSRLASAR